ncbi:MAG TPA: hypothetical protein VGL78_16665 [Solirubrobacteraceae bacterium]
MRVTRSAPSPISTSYLLAAGRTPASALIEEERPEQPAFMTLALLVGTDKAAFGVEPSVSGSDVGGMPARVA